MVCAQATLNELDYPTAQKKCGISLFIIFSGLNFDKDLTSGPPILKAPRKNRRHFWHNESMEGAEPELPPEQTSQGDDQIAPELGNEVYSLTGVDDALSKPEAAPQPESDRKEEEEETKEPHSDHENDSPHAEEEAQAEPPETEEDHPEPESKQSASDHEPNHEEEEQHKSSSSSDKEKKSSDSSDAEHDTKKSASASDEEKEKEHSNEEEKNDSQHSEHETEEEAKQEEPEHEEEEKNDSEHSQKDSEEDVKQEEPAHEEEERHEEADEPKSKSSSSSSSSSSEAEPEGDSKAEAEPEHDEEPAPVADSELTQSEAEEEETKLLEERPEPEEEPQEEELPKEVPSKPATSNAKSRGNRPVKGMTVKDDYKAPTLKSPRSIPGEVSVTNLPPLVTDPEKDAESERLLKKFRDRGIAPTESDLRSQLTQYIQRQKVNALCKNRFTEAAKLQELARKLTLAIEQAGSKDVKKEKLDVLEQKLAIARERVTAHEAETRKLMREEAAKQKQRMRALEDQQDTELGDFEDKWNDPEFLAKFAKPSANLLALKKVERALILAKDFEKADGYKVRVEELEKEESNNAQNRARMEMKQQYQRLLQRHETERNALSESSKKAMEMLQHDRETQLATLNAVQSKIQTQIDDMKNSRAQPLPPLKPGRSRSATQELFPQEVMTPRTAQRLALYKARMTQPKVVVRPLGVISRRGRRRNKTARDGEM